MMGVFIRKENYDTKRCMQRKGYLKTQWEDIHPHAKKTWIEHLDLQFKILESENTNFCCLISHPVCGTLFWQPMQLIYFPPFDIYTFSIMIPWKIGHIINFSVHSWVINCPTITLSHNTKSGLNNKSNILINLLQQSVEV